MSSLETRGPDPRRADLVLWYLWEKKIAPRDAARCPVPIEYRELGLVHTAVYLESLLQPAVLARIFAVDEKDVPVDEVMRTLRMACGGTRDAARHVLAHGGAALNLLGGFHHASPSSGGGFCALNDVAVAIAVLRAEGFAGRVNVLDLDAHPPDGTAECLKADPRAWIGSISGAQWEPLPKVDEVVLPSGSGDEAYASALRGLLGRMPEAELAFVLAGGDVLRGDRLGSLGLTLAGTRARDTTVRDALVRIPSVWLPAGGYSDGAWKALAGTGLVLAGRERHRIAPGFDPLRARFSRVSRQLGPAELSGESWLSTEELEEVLHVKHAGRERLLGFYTREGVEYALSKFGVWERLQRLGYAQLRVMLSRGSDGERLRVLGTSDGAEHLLIDLVLEPKAIGDRTYLYANWLTLRHPRARFAPQRPALPGQDVPGLGLAREVSELLARIAKRLQLAGVAFRPSWYHMAFAARHQFAFVDPSRQGRFLALTEALRGVPLLEATHAVADAAVTLEGTPYAWEADEMVQGLDRTPEEQARITAAAKACHFEYRGVGTSRTTP